MKVGDLVKHKFGSLPGVSIVTKISRYGPPGTPVYVTAMWKGWAGERSLEQQYLEVVSESR